MQNKVKRFHSTFEERNSFEWPITTQLMWLFLIEKISHFLILFFNTLLSASETEYVNQALPFEWVSTIGYYYK